MMTHFTVLVLGIVIGWFARHGTIEEPEQDHEQATGPKLVADTETADEWPADWLGRA